MRAPPLLKRAPGATPGDTASTRTELPTTDKHSHRQSNLGHRPLVVVVARARWLPPSGNRELGVFVVSPCPLCMFGVHLHRGGPASGMRRAGCGLGQYRVTVAGGWSH